MKRLLEERAEASGDAATEPAATQCVSCVCERECVQALGRNREHVGRAGAASVCCLLYTSPSPRDRG
eukprot:1910626-Rhodomonas_salina.1